jgi:hypothetical protein
MTAAFVVLRLIAVTLPTIDLLIFGSRLDKMVE